eukprot:TRINITY_DN1140_c0_g1_i5.p1 TRINITY_DN1140_c0_g1~~TRINITY_DN1140_c0_g1_i5.p1  ORF type:complete len:115 (-),score=58.15 TRINITY_DN1140_c0_g1_i5:74-418(-)
MTSSSSSATASSEKPPVDADLAQDGVDATDKLATEEVVEGIELIGGAPTKDAKDADEKDAEAEAEAEAQVAYPIPVVADLAPIIVGIVTLTVLLASLANIFFSLLVYGRRWKGE